MDKISWCLKKGMELVEPNENLSEAYIRKAENALRASNALKDNKDWEVSSAYYTQYFGVYSILMKIGIKSEIHSCTLAFMNEFLEDFTKEEIDFITRSKKARNDIQNYSDRNISDELYEMIINDTAMFLVKCKHVLKLINDPKIEEIRTRLRSFIK